MTERRFITTPIYALLRNKGLLAHRLAHIGIAPEAFVRRFGRDHGNANLNPVSSPLDAESLERLEGFGLIASDVADPGNSYESDRRPRRPLLSLAFVAAVNLELTYRCNLECGHCLQQNLRGAWANIDLATETAKEAISDAWFAGLFEPGRGPAGGRYLRGLNLTGGEPLLKADVVFELIDFARSMGIMVRLNTNSWWGTQSGFALGGHHFDTPGHLVGYLKELGLSMLAFSFDVRFDQDPAAFDRLAGSVTACERARMEYQLVCTGEGPTRNADIAIKLRTRTGKNLDYLNPVTMEMIDVGGAASRDPCPCDPGRDLAGDARRSPCRRRGFIVPQVLHIDPSGGVRSCLCAPGLQNMGSLRESTFIEILNRFPDNPVSRAFSKDGGREAGRGLFLPCGWKNFAHPCSASAVLARLIDSASRFEKRNGRSAEGEDLLGINRTIAVEMNLAKDSLSEC